MVENLPTRIQLEIVTPDRRLFAGEVGMVTVPGAEGYMGILPGHAPLISELKIGIISYQVGHAEFQLFCSWGFVEVLPDQVSILAEEAETPDQIDIERARAEFKEAEALLRTRDPNLDYPAVVRKWEAARTRLEVAGEPVGRG